MSPAARGDLATYGRLLEYVRVQWWLFAASIVGFGIYAGSHVALAELLALTVDAVKRVAGGDDAGALRWIIPAAMIATVLVRGLGTFIGQYFLALVSNNVVHRLRCQLFEQLLTLPSAYYDRSAQGHLVSRVTYTVAQVTGAATKAVEVIVREGLTVIGLAAWLLYMNWKLTAVFLALAPVIGVIVRWANRRFRRTSRRIQHAMGDVTQVAAEAVQGYREVRTFGGTDYERERFAAASDLSRRQTVKMAVIGALSSPLIQIFVSFALALLVFLILDPRLLGSMTEGDVVAFITAAGLLAKPIRQLTEINAVIQRGLAAAEDIFAQIDEPPERDLGSLDVDRVAGRIELRDLVFGYEPERAVLRGISLRIEPGETVALVGRSGSGKSTLVGLIPRFHDPLGGEILLDDAPLQDYRLACLRRQVALVSQHVTLFNDTVRNNIAYGSLADAPDSAVLEAARRAHALEFIEQLPDGMDTLVGDDGVLLSGGQRQRLAIARAILKDAPVLILDEATSALDSESEQHIQLALDEVMRGRTTLVIAHRLSTIESADRILVLDDGRIAEQGSHVELIARGGLYAGLHRRQFPEAEDATAASGTETPEGDGVGPGSAAAPAGLEARLNALWYGDGSAGRWLAPLGSLTGWVARRRWRRHRAGRGDGFRAAVPVIVVGNVTVGGTGKTPLVIWLVNWLREQGWTPGVVSRGHGGAVGNAPLPVTAASDPDRVGEEAPLIALRTGAPVVVHPDRGAAVERLLEQGPDIVVADDGLQHYALARDLEIAVLDGQRGLGNGRCLPAGPLREPAGRLETVDFIVATGPLRAPERELPHYEQQLRPSAFVSATGEEHGLDALPRGRVHAVAGIGHPDRFFATLQALGFEVVGHPLDDHHVHRAGELDFGDDLPVLVTEKDLVRIARLPSLPEGLRALRVEAEPDTGFVSALAARLAELGEPAASRQSDEEWLP